MRARCSAQDSHLTALHLEITESLAAQDESVQQQLRDLKSLGVQLALDDFGTGYSSLASLHELPVDIVKIDRSFVSQSDSSHHHRVLIEATVRVANSLGMRTVAEGIETEAQARRRTGTGVRQGAGLPVQSARSPHWNSCVGWARRRPWRPEHGQKLTGVKR